MDVAISIVTYNSHQVIEKCLSQIDKKLPIFICDNYSSIDIEPFINQVPDRNINLIKLEKNIGFSAAHNLNCMRARTKYILILNPDCFINDAALNEMVKVAENNPNTVMVGPIFLNQTSPIPNSPSSVQFISGACMLLRKSVFDEIGLFDENIFLYFEDNELCFRVKKLGYDLMVTPNAVVQHLKGKSTPTTRSTNWLKAYYFGKSKMYYLFKIHPKRKIKNLLNYQIFCIKGLIKTTLISPHRPHFEWHLFNLIGACSSMIKPKSRGFLATFLRHKVGKKFNRI